MVLVGMEFLSLPFCAVPLIKAISFPLFWAGDISNRINLDLLFTITPTCCPLYIYIGVPGAYNVLFRMDAVQNQVSVCIQVSCTPPYLSSPYGGSSGEHIGTEIESEFEYREWCAEVAEPAAVAADCNQSG